jgi:hypothetical protein
MCQTKDDNPLNQNHRLNLMIKMWPHDLPHEIITTRLNLITANQNMLPWTSTPSYIIIIAENHTYILDNVNRSSWTRFNLYLRKRYQVVTIIAVVTSHQHTETHAHHPHPYMPCQNDPNHWFQKMKLSHSIQIAISSHRPCSINTKPSQHRPSNLHWSPELYWLNRIH